MSLSPCPCMPLQQGVKVLAIIDTVFSILNLGLFILALISLLFFNGEDQLEDSDKGSAVVIVGLGILIASLQVLLAFRLYHGAKTKDGRRCRSWLVATVVIITIYIISLVSNRKAEDFKGVALAIFLVVIIYKLFEIVVVVAFTEQLKQEFQNRFVYPTVAAPQSQPFYPGSNVYTIDPPPSYFHVQNHTTIVEPPPPYSADLAVTQNN